MGAFVINFFVAGMLLQLGFICGKEEAWVNHGAGILNHRRGAGYNHRRGAGYRQRITPFSVTSLSLQWEFVTGFNVSATPSVANETIYFPGWDGNLYALQAKTGLLIWKKNLTELTGVTTLARATPVIHKHLLLVGLHGPPIVLALDRSSGILVWRTEILDNASEAVITMSGTVFQGFYFVGTSSLEENFGTCCSFQGSFLKIRLTDGVVVWRTYMQPRNSGYFGASVWGSSPPVDVGSRLVYIATGNNYKLPKSVEQCELRRLNNTRQYLPDLCEVPEDHHDSILALHVDDGSIAWSRQFQGYDVWTYACFSKTNTTNCPPILGPDYDFGEAPMLLYFRQQDRARHQRGSNSWGGRCLVVAGQKSGVVWALDCETGAVVWSTMAGPGGDAGGATWGSCTDGERVYTNIVNNYNANFTLAPSKEVTTGGGWVAMDAKTGKVVWTTANPTGAPASGPVSMADGVVFGGSFSLTGEVYAMDAKTGSILWQRSTGANICGGFSVVGGCIYGGNGYASAIAPSRQGVAVFAFCLPDAWS